MTENKLKHPLQQAQEAEVYMMEFSGEQRLGLKTLPSFSSLTWGYGSGRVIICAARTSQGKSAFLAQNCFDFARQGLKTVFLSLEMSSQELGMRNFCREEKIDNYEILRGGFKKNEEKWKNYVKGFVSLKLTMSDCLGKTWSEINGIIEEMKLNKPDVIFIDHINDIRMGGTNDKQIMDDYLLNLRVMAKQHKITFIIGAQINRAAQTDDDKLPQLHHLKGTGKLEEVADMVILLHWPYFYNKNKDINEYMILIAKNRHGQTGFHQVEFWPEYSLFREITVKKEEKIKKVKDITQSKINEEDVIWEE